MDSSSELIRSRTNQRYRRFLQIKERGSADLCLLEGPKLVEEAVLAGLSFVEVAVAPRAESRDPIRRHLVTLDERGVPIHRLDDSLLSSLSETETTQGLVALARRPTFEEDRLFEGTPL